MKNYAILLASGSGERAGTDLPKQFLRISGKTILEHSIEIFEKHELIDHIILVIHRMFLKKCKDIINSNGYKKIIKIVVGGKTRQESSAIGIQSINEIEANVLIHDAVRPLLPKNIIDKCINALKQYDAVDVAIPTPDTIIEIDELSNIAHIPERTNLRRGQTPQAFKLSLIRTAHKLASDSQATFTDDCGIIHAFSSSKIHVIDGSEENIKMTYPIDFFIADKLFQIRSAHAHANLQDIKDKIIVIFGGNGGIGREIYKLATKARAKAYAFSRTNGVDVKDKNLIKKSLSEVFAREGRIDCVINTAGVLNVGPFLAKFDDEIHDEINTNFLGCINVAKESYEYLKHSSGTLLFFTSSSYTHGRGMYSIYSSTKAAIVNFVQALSEEWHQFGIRINAINPARTLTSMRLASFKGESKETLLPAKFVAEQTLLTVLQDYTGQVVDIKKGLTLKRKP